MASQESRPQGIYVPASSHTLGRADSSSSWRKVAGSPSRDQSEPSSSSSAWSSVKTSSKSGLSTNTRGTDAGALDKNKPRGTQFMEVLSKGRVVALNMEKKFGFLAPIMSAEPKNDFDSKIPKGSGKEVFFRFGHDDTLTGGMVLTKGDTMKFLAGTEVEKPRAVFAKLSKCYTRSSEELVAYVTSLVDLSEEKAGTVLRNITLCPAGLLLVLAQSKPSSELVRLVLHLCENLTNCKEVGLYSSRLNQTYKLFCSSRFLTSANGVRKFVHTDYVEKESLKEFLLQLLEFVPSQLQIVMPVLSALVLPEDRSDNEEQYEEFRSEPEGRKFLLKVLHVLGGRGADEDICGLAWSDLPLLPTRREISTNMKTGSNSGLDDADMVTLPVVRQIGSYESAESYMDTYFRLLREDCFAGLKKGIQSLRAGKLDSTDMKVWSHISVEGIHFERVSPGVTFALGLGTKRSPALILPMGGSLVCLADDGGRFDSPIWGVVSRCEETSTKKHICFVEIVQSPAAGMGEETMASEATLYGRLMKKVDLMMVESPTYYRAYQPVLKSLQHMDPLSIPFQEEVVHARWPNEAPAYLQNPDTVLDWSCILQRTREFSGGLGLVGGTGDLDSLLKRGHKTSLDKSQLEAVKLALSSRLAIIQGPPGTGKTYIGVKILELLLSANTFPSRPVLVITYKNHSLDQFLEKCLSFSKEGGSIVRVGGRCENPNLQQFNLQNFVLKRDEYNPDRADNSRKLKELQTELEIALWNLNSSQTEFGISTVMAYASDLQLRAFLRGPDVHSTLQVDVLLSSLPEGIDIAESLHTSLPEDMSAESAAILERLKTLLIKEIKRWIPARAVLKSVIECFSHKKPAKKVLIESDSQAMRTFSAQSRNPPCEVTGEMVDTRQEEEERRRAYETMRQEIKEEGFNPNSTNQGARSDTQWLKYNFFALPDKEVVDSEIITIEHLNLDAGQFDWLLLENPWNLSRERRAILALMLWQKSVSNALQNFASIKSEYDVLVHDMDEINKRRKVAVLQEAKIIGMTTTGAAMQQDVLKFLSPAVILVEEAAEILEPQLLAVLNSDLEHLILIGDHHQLRPSVESFELERWHGFGVSMFERLVEHNKLPFQALNLQCRMREEFVPMLLPIYPGLQSHEELVSGSKNQAPACMTQTFCFWSHPYEETIQRSYVNQGEAQMVVALAQWIVSETEASKDLTILAAYRGQVTIIRALLANLPELQDVEVCSIDKFQGAENQIVIVSLVRSNPEGKIGHLSIRNRLCVAVSRARSGVYLCGNDTTLSRTSHWRVLISFFETHRSLTPSISLSCPRHRQEPAYQLSCLDVTNFSPTEVCQKPCRAQLHCGHFCSKTCHAGAHCLCREKVAFTFDQCGHTGVKFCHEDAEDKVCETKISHTFEVCGHITECECWKTWKTSALKQGTSLKCQFACGKTLPGCGHACTLLCSDDCAGVPCKACSDIQEEKAKIQRQVLREVIAQNRKELDVEIQRLKNSGDEGFVVTEVHPNNETAKDFYMAKDRTEKYIQWDHKMMPIVTKVEKIENLKLQRKFLEAQKELYSPVEVADWLFYGADNRRMEQIVLIGFGTISKKGCSLEVNSTSIAHLEGGSKLLLCEVQLGKTWRVTNVDPEMDLKLLKKKGYDSLSIGAQGGTRVQNHIIYNGTQAIPRFIVHYKLEDRSAIAEMKGFESFGSEEAREANGVVRLPLTPSPNFKGDCPEEYHFRMAESQFFRMSINRCYKVTKVELIYNVALRERYLDKRAEFTKLADTPPEEKFVFHGTDTAAIDKISEEGFKIGGEGVAIKTGAAFGRGVYTAVHPDTSIAYSRGSNMMLLSLALPGILGTHHSLGEGPQVIVLKNVHQLLPKYVVHYQ